MHSGGAAICVSVPCLAVVRFSGGMLRESSSDEDVQQYAVRLLPPPDLPPTLLAPLFESVMSASRAGSTHRECDEDITCTTGAQHRTLKERPILSGYWWQF